MGFGDWFEQAANKIPSTGSNSGKGLTRATLNRVIVDNNVLKVDTRFSDLAGFLLNPESYEETKTANWAPIVIPGQSDPILQWVAGGPRTVSFDALVTKETSDTKKNTNTSFASNLASSIESTAIGQIAASIAGVFETASAILTPKAPAAAEPALSIKANLDYYRSMLYPNYTGNVLSQSPPLLTLGNGVFDSPTVIDIGTTDLWVMTNLRIQVTKQLPNLTPMEATVSFQLTQYITTSFDGNQFLP